MDVEGEIDENQFQLGNGNETYGLKHPQPHLPCQDDSALEGYNL
jgi:hypothetical protein